MDTMNSPNVRAAAAVAVVGIGCRFPGGSGVGDFWDTLLHGRDALQRRVDGNERSRLGASATAARGMLQGVDGFDYEFFGIPAREARMMDPQQRLLLQVSWEALEDSGIPKERLGSTTGVFVGMQSNEYGDLRARQGLRMEPHGLTGEARASAAGRLSWFLDIHGPSLVVDSDRSSSLVAVHLACNSIRLGECDTALAAGVNLALTPDLTDAFERVGLLAADARCKFGDAAADGFVRSEAVAVVLLKRLELALLHRDRIYAIVRGGAVQSAGSSGGDLVRPSVASQEALLRAAHRAAGVQAEEVRYVEAHGTGTPVGDEVELTALRNVVGSGRHGVSQCAVGSVKSNIGHTEAAAGITGLIKTALVLHHRTLVPSLHYKRSRADLPVGPGLGVQTELHRWPESEGKIIAGVSSFGLTGTNAHLVLESAPPRAASESAGSADELVLPVSARSDAALDQLAERMVELLSHSDSCAQDVCFSAAIHRSHLSKRLAVVAENAGELRSGLQSILRGERSRFAFRGCMSEKPRVAFVFSGTGSQWAGMGKGLFESEPVFRKVIERCDDIVRQEAGWSLVHELLTSDSRSEKDIGVVQPLLTAVNLAIASLWQHWGVRPEAVIGASVGEFAAAHVAGILSIEDTLRAVCRRSELMRKVSGGAMSMVELSANDAKLALDGYEGRISIAANNGPHSTVFSGHPLVLNQFVEGLASKGVVARTVLVDVAAHGPSMDPILEEYESHLRGLVALESRLPIASTLNGDWQKGDAFDARYWVRQMREPVLFYPALQRLLREGYNLFIEVSPHPILSSPILDAIGEHGCAALALPSLLRNKPERQSILATLATLYSEGVDVNWGAIQGHRPRRAELPHYPWQERSCWFHGEHRRDAGVWGEGVYKSGEAGRTTRMDSTSSASGSNGRASTIEQASFEEELRQQVAHILGNTAEHAIDVNQPFRELGLTSLMMTELRVQLERRYGSPIATSVLFNYPTVTRLAAFLRERGHDARVRSAGGPKDAGRSSEVSGSADGAERRESQSALPAIEGREARVVASEARSDAYVRSEDDAREDPIAIVGMACRFPGCNDVESYWDLLCAERCAVGEIPEARWDANAYYDANGEMPGKMFTRWGGFVESAGRFDAAFFGISPKEALSMDPQQRMLLEVAWEALEDANIDPASLAGTSGSVFAGLQSFGEYARLKTVDSLRIGAHDPAGDSISIATGRIAYTLGLRGPAVSIDTACSSSLVALHYACSALRRGESDIAIAGGVNILASPEVMLGLSKAHMLSQRGKCRTFDAGADGYVRAEGCGMLVLKRMSDALSAGERIHAVIRGTAVNQDGRSSGLTAPNGLAQEALIRSALKTAGLTPEQVTYVEAHGTGTPLGDPIEYQAVSNVFTESRPEDRPLLLGSVKTNIGHLESAAGVAGLIKVVLTLQHGQIPAHLHLEQLNSHIEENQAVRIPRQMTQWPVGAPAIGAVNSFGFSGTNAHVILERAPQLANQEVTRLVSKRPLQLLTLSARSEEALRAMTGRYVAHLVKTEAPLADVALTSQTAREHARYRIAVVAPTSEVAVERLVEFGREGRAPGVYQGEVLGTTGGRLAFLFTGQGSHYPGMGKQLFDTERVFRRSLQKCGELLFEHLDRPLESVLYGGDEELLNDQNYSQLALFALEHSLYEMWRSWGVEPAFVMGHSLGEYAAACAAGVLSVEDALKTIALRGPLAARLPDKGQAAAVWASAERVRPLVDRRPTELSIAAINAPERLLVSGKAGALAELLPQLESMGIQCKLLKGLVAVHSPLMDPMLDDFEAHMRTVKLSPPRIPIVSSVTGKLVTGDELCTPEYWRRHVRQPVLFYPAMKTLHELGARSFLEIGPHWTLSRLGQECLTDPAAVWQTSLSKERSPWEQALESLGRLHVHGVNIDFRKFQEASGARLTPLPKYPWQGKDYWIEPAARGRRRLAGQRHALVGERIASPLKDVQFESSIDVATLPFLKDHKLWDTVVVPGALHLERVLATAAELLHTDQVCIEGVEFPEAVVLAVEEESRLSQLVATSLEDGAYAVRILSTEPGVEHGPWATHLSARVSSGYGVESSVHLRDGASRLDALNGCGEQENGSELYNRMTSWGYGLGPAFQWIQARIDADSDAWFHLKMPKAAHESDAVVFHPSLVDSLFQVLTHAPSKNGVKPANNSLYVPVSIERFVAWHRPSPGNLLHCRIVLHESVPSERLADVQLFDGQALCAELINVRIKLVSRQTLIKPKARELERAVCSIDWHDVPLEIPHEPSDPTLRRSGTWLLFSSNPELTLGASLPACFEDAGESCLVVSPGAEYKFQDGKVCVRQGQKADLVRLFDSLHAMGHPPLRGVVYAHDFVPVTTQDGLASQCFEPVVNNTVELLALAQALSTLEAVEPPKLWLVTRGAVAVNESDSVSLGGALQAPLWGLGRTIATELSHVWGGLVDTDSAPNDGIELFEQLWYPHDEGEVAFRNGRRLSARLATIESSAQHGGSRSTGEGRLRSDRTYLITGGLGALGLKLARALARGGARHIALMGRSPAGERALDVIDELRRAGTRVITVKADVARRDQLAQAIADLSEAMPPVAGVAHAAGTLADALIVDQTWDSFAKVLAPKLSGAINLQAQFANHPLDFFLHFSSVAAVVGNHGQANYAAANAFLDAFARVQRSLGVPAVAVNWGPWGEVGMAAGLVDDFYERWGFYAIPPDAGVRLALSLATQARAQVGVMPCDWSRFRRSWAGESVPSLFTDVVNSAQDKGGTSPRRHDVLERLAAVDDEQRYDVLTDALRSIVVDILGADANAAINPEQRLEDFGVDSLMSIALVRALESNLRIALPKNAINLHPTLHRLADYLLLELNGPSALVNESAA